MINKITYEEILKYMTVRPTFIYMNDNFILSPTMGGSSGEIFKVDLFNEGEKTTDFRRIMLSQSFDKLGSYLELSVLTKEVSNKVGKHYINDRLTLWDKDMEIFISTKYYYIDEFDKKAGFVMNLHDLEIIREKRKERSYNKYHHNKSVLNSHKKEIAQMIRNSGLRGTKTIKADDIRYIERKKDYYVVNIKRGRYETKSFFFNKDGKRYI